MMPAFWPASRQRLYRRPSQSHDEDALLSGHPFNRLIQHAGKRWAYSTPSPPFHVGEGGLVVPEPNSMPRKMFRVLLLFGCPEIEVSLYKIEKRLPLKKKKGFPQRKNSLPLKKRLPTEKKKGYPKKKCYPQRKKNVSLRKKNVTLTGKKVLPRRKLLFPTRTIYPQKPFPPFSAQT